MRRTSDVFVLQFTRLVGQGCACGHLRLSATWFFTSAESFLLPLPLVPFTRVRVLQSSEGSSALCFSAGIAFPAQVTDAAHTLAFILSSAPALAHVVFTFREGEGAVWLHCKGQTASDLKSASVILCRPFEDEEGISFLLSLSHHAVTPTHCSLLLEAFLCSHLVFIPDPAVHLTLLSPLKERKKDSKLAHLLLLSRGN